MSFSKNKNGRKVRKAKNFKFIQFANGCKTELFYSVCNHKNLHQMKYSYTLPTYLILHLLKGLQEGGGVSDGYLSASHFLCSRLPPPPEETATQTSAVGLRPELTPTPQPTFCLHFLG